MRFRAHLIKKFRQASAPDRTELRGIDQQVYAVDLFPHFRRNRVAHRACVFACRIDTDNNRIWIFPIEDKKLYDSLGGSSSIAVSKYQMITAGIDQRLPLTRILR